jgi:hypothetical protein
MQDALDAASRLPPRALFLARRIAQAQFDVKRVRLARHGLLAMKFADPRYRTRKGLMARIRTLGKAGDLLLRGVPVPPDMARAINERPQGAEKMAVILADFSKELAAMDRYERRALSRRKRAIRAFDDALSEAAAERRTARPPRAGSGTPPMRPFRQNNFRRQIQSNQRRAGTRAFRRNTIALVATAASARIPRPRCVPRKFWQNNFRRKPQRDQRRATPPEHHRGRWAKPP